MEETAETDSIYVGPYDENGQRYGRGVGLYSGGYVYAGEYADDVRSGEGSWYYPDGSYYIGLWADDMPNGEGKIIFSSGGWDEGYFQNGLAEGTYYSQTSGSAQYRYNCEGGIPKSMGIADESDGYGASGETIMAYKKQGDEDWSVAPHYWAGLQCADCGGTIGIGAMPEWFQRAFSHTWSGWKENAMVFGVQPWGNSK